MVRGLGLGPERLKLKSLLCQGCSLGSHGSHGHLVVHLVVMVPQHSLPHIVVGRKGKCRKREWYFKLWWVHSWGENQGICPKDSINFWVNLFKRLTYFIWYNQTVSQDCEPIRVSLDGIEQLNKQLPGKNAVSSWSEADSQLVSLSPIPPCPHSKIAIQWSCQREFFPLPHESCF